VVQYNNRGKGQPSRDVFTNPCAEHFILFQIGCAAGGGAGAAARRAGA
jgi:hypothetical protein